ncbi:MAG TPA: hypothetical protein PLW34_02670 [Termitinemataceae bacterium]|nr:hypothetical protein [Termitinemataceae bacterium]HOM22817.1 hypothetical protein [Termitinemataceae bacterium]HPP99758.1 hypothetical protein [Termitinemataceae bacterium]
MGKKIQAFTGIVLAVGGFLLLLGGIINMTDPNNPNIMQDVVTLPFPFGLLVGGIALYRASQRGQKKERNVNLERGIIFLAQQQGGLITPTEVVLHLGVSIEEAQALLDGLCRRGLAQIQVSAEGTLVYRIEGLLSPAEKARVTRSENLL